MKKPLLVLTLSRQKAEVATIHEAQLAVRKLSMSIGGTEFCSRHPQSGAVLRRDGKTIGHLSYNARWWPKGIPHSEVGPNYLGDLTHVVHVPNPKETTMSKSKSPKKVAPTIDAAATEPVVVTSATKKAAAKEAKVAKPPKARKTPVEDLVVFAFRLTATERDAIHKAAGPANASKFIRTLAIAAAANDRAQVELILKGVNQPDA